MTTAIPMNLPDIPTWSTNLAYRQLHASPICPGIFKKQIEIFSSRSANGESTSLPYGLLNGVTLGVCPTTSFLLGDPSHESLTKQFRKHHSPARVNGLTLICFSLEIKSSPRQKNRHISLFGVLLRVRSTSAALWMMSISQSVMYHLQF